MKVYEIFKNLHEATKDMILTSDNVNKLKNKAMNEYWEYQAIMAGQSLKDEDEVQSNFDEIAVELGMNSEDLWQEFENDHARSVDC